ncbi:unnamed protein product [Caenorhabditis sp. 36 PRJEB53466]|nr:unnamed protein product [Caenorhabditis sp. 36 PRJEB53466]
MMLMPMKLIRSAAKLGLTMTGYNTTDFDRKVVRIFSPKIMSVVPPSEEARKDEIDVLSPSLFALHEDGADVEKQASLANILGSLTGNKDSEQFLDFIVEATGVDEAMERVEKKLGDSSPLFQKGPEGQPLYFTKENITEKYPKEARKIEMFEALDKTYTREQLAEMNRTGYTIMRSDQMELVYGRGSVVENLEFLRTVQNLSRPQINRNIMGTIKDLARERVKFEARKSDVVLSPITFTNFIFDPVGVSQPIILSPILIVSLIGSPAIYGVVILSPWVMVPVILSPRIFAPPSPPVLGHLYQRDAKVSKMMDEQFGDGPSTSSAENPSEIVETDEKTGTTTVHQYVDEQGRTLYIEDPYYYEENGSTVVYGQPFEALSQEIYQEEIVDDSFTEPHPKPAHRTNKRALIKENYSTSTVLLTSESLEAQNATFMSKAGKRSEKMKAVSDPKRINQDGSSLNKNLPGMKNMLKVIAESQLKKAEIFLKEIKKEEKGEEIAAEAGEEVREEVEDEGESSDAQTPPPMERIETSSEDFHENKFDQWALYSRNPIDFKEACELLIGIQPLDTEKVYDGKGHLKEWTDGWNYKIVLKKYENQTTKKGADDGRGIFQKKIYTGLRVTQKLTHAIVTYSWCSGRSWNFVPPVKKKTNWEKKSYEKVNMTSMPQMVSAFYEGFNIYSHCVINFDEAAAIMLGATNVEINKLCSSVPIGYRQDGTFVIDLKRMGHCTLELRRDENGLWSKPSGFSRFYKFAENGDAVRVDRAGKLPAGQEYDVKVSSKRYENTQVDKKFVRKIYTAKGKNSETFPGSPEFAVIVYYWKGEAIEFGPVYKQNIVHTESKSFARFQQMDDEEEQFVEAAPASIIQGEEARTQQIRQPPLKRARYQPTENVIEMKMSVIRREMENQERFSAVLDRAEAILGRMEQRMGVVEQVYAVEPVEHWPAEQIIEEEVIHENY